MGRTGYKVLWPPDCARTPYGTACSSGTEWHVTLSCGHEVVLRDKGKGLPEQAVCPKGCK